MLAAAVPAARVSVEEPAPGAPMEAGLKLAEAPVGTVAERAMAELKPPETAVVTVTLPELPWATVKAPGETDRVKSGLAVGLNTTSMTAWSSIPFGATPV